MEVTCHLAMPMGVEKARAACELTCARLKAMLGVDATERERVNFSRHEGLGSQRR